MGKYNNRKTTCLSKHTHDSKLEADYCNRLLADKQKGEIVNYLTQIKFDLGAGINYIADFVVIRRSNGIPVVEVHETKGFFTQAARIKKKLFEAKYPFINYVLIYKRRARCRKLPWRK